MVIAMTLFAQVKNVSGVVLDKKGESIIGASVLVKGTTNGTITGIDGDFSLSGVKSLMSLLLLTLVLRTRK